MGPFETFDNVLQLRHVPHVRISHPQRDLGVTHGCQIALNRPWCEPGPMQMGDKTAQSPLCDWVGLMNLVGATELQESPAPRAVHRLR